MATITGANARGGDPKPVRFYLSEVLEPTTKGKAVYYLQPEGMDGELHIGRTYTMDGRLKVDGRYKDAALTIEEGTFTYYHANGRVESQGDYTMGNKAGLWMRYDVAGNQLAEKIYDPEPLANILYSRAETMPTYAEGGEKALVRTIREKVDDTGIELKGQAVASFIVEKDGRLTDVKLVEGHGPGVDQQIVDAIKATSPWAPGSENGVPVRVQMRVPVRY